jgi:signal transduction histidine kinase
MNVESLVSQQIDSLPAVASIVHDLRNPLSAIHCGAEILIRSGLSGGQIDKIARIMYGASVRMKDLVDEILITNRTTDDSVGPCDLRDLIEGAVDRIALLAEAQSVQILLDVAGNLVLPLDWGRIQRVFVNLMVNSLEVLPNGGAIHISATPLTHSVLVKVSDSGPGIDPEIRERLFEPFATTGKAHGLGLGLAFSRKAIVDHGGQIWAESSSRGACFAFYLPFAKKVAAFALGV